MSDCHRRQRHFFSVPSVWLCLSLQLPLVDKPLNTSLEDFASVWVLLKTTFRLPWSHLFVCRDIKILNLKRTPKGTANSSIKRKGRSIYHWSLNWPLFSMSSFTRGTGASLWFHGDLDAFTADCKGRLCLKMPLKHNRSQQVIPAQKIKQQGTSSLFACCFFFHSIMTR